MSEHSMTSARTDTSEPSTSACRTAGHHHSETKAAR